MTNIFIYLAKMSNLTWKLNSLFWVILSQNLCKFYYSIWPILCPAKAAFENNKTMAKNSWKFVIKWAVSLLQNLLTPHHFAALIFDFCMSVCPLKESNQKNFNFCQSKRPLKESNQKKFDFWWSKLTEMTIS